MMHEHGKSDGSVVPAKPSNKAEQPAAERVEERGPAKGNALQQTTRRTQGRESVPQVLQRIRRVAKTDRKVRFTSLMHHIYNPATLREAYFGLKRDAAPGADGQTWQQYGLDLEGNLQDLSARLKRGAYRVKPCA